MLTTFRKPPDQPLCVDYRAKSPITYPNEAVGIASVAVEFHNGKNLSVPLAIPFHLCDADDELGRGVLPGLRIFQIKLIWVRVHVDVWAVWEEVEEEAERGTEREAVPELTDRICGLTLAVVARGQRAGDAQERCEALDADELLTELGALLVEGGGRGC